MSSTTVDPQAVMDAMAALKRGENPTGPAADFARQLMAANNKETTPAPTEGEGHPLSDESLMEALDLEEDDLEDLKEAGITSLEDLAAVDAASPPEILEDIWGKNRVSAFLEKTKQLSEERKGEAPAQVQPTPTAHPLSDESLMEALDLEEDDLEDLKEAGITSLEDLAAVDAASPPEILEDIWGKNRVSAFLEKTKQLAEERKGEAPAPAQVQPTIGEHAEALELTPEQILALDTAGYKTLHDLVSERIVRDKSPADALGSEKKASAVLKRARRTLRKLGLPTELIAMPAPAETPLIKVAGQLQITEDVLAVLTGIKITTLEGLAGLDPEAPPQEMKDEWGKDAGRLITRAIGLAEAKATERAKAEGAARAKGSASLRLLKMAAQQEVDRKSTRDTAIDQIRDASDEAGVKIRREPVNYEGQSGQMHYLVTDWVFSGMPAEEAVAKAIELRWTEELPYLPETKVRMWEELNSRELKPNYNAPPIQINGNTVEVDAVEEICKLMEDGVEMDTICKMGLESRWIYKRRVTQVYRAFSRARRPQAASK